MERMILLILSLAALVATKYINSQGLRSASPEDSKDALITVVGVFLKNCRSGMVSLQGRKYTCYRRVSLTNSDSTFMTSGTSQRQCTKDKQYFVHERNCDMYYQCVNGTMREGICPDGLVFDDKQPPETIRCDLPFDIDCSYRSALQPPLSSDHCPRLYGLYAHETDCSRFWKCAEGHAFSFNCPEGLAYNEYSAHCDWPDMVENCDSESLLRFQCPQPTDQELQEYGDPRYPFPGDCRKHYVCILTPDGSRQPRLLACDPGLVFNPQTSSCDDPENVSGCQGYYNNLDARRLRELFGRR